jgi:hypothetical protein
VRDCVCRLDVATCDRLAAPNQSEQPEALQEKLARPARWIRYSLRHRAPLLRFVVPSALISRGALAFVGRSRGSRPRELIRLGTSQTVQLETADALWGGSFVTFQVTIVDATPIVCDLPCAGAIGESDLLFGTFAGDPAMSSDTV